MTNSNWKKTKVQLPENGESIYVYRGGVAIHAVVKNNLVKLDDGRLEPVRHYQYWAKNDIIVPPESDGKSAKPQTAKTDKKKKQQ